jgi:hypothetical protein
VAGLLDDNVAIYAMDNNGGGCDPGFLLGSSGWGFLAGNRCSITHRVFAKSQEVK